MTDGSKIFCFCSKWFRLRRVFARVTKLVDVEDLKSSALIRRVGSIPTPGTKKRPKVVFYCPGEMFGEHFVWESKPFSHIFERFHVKKWETGTAPVGSDSRLVLILSG